MKQTPVNFQRPFMIHLKSVLVLTLPITNKQVTFAPENMHGKKGGHVCLCLVRLQLGLCFMGALLLVLRKIHLQGGPLLAIGGVINPINGLKYMDNWAERTLLIGVISSQL